MNKDIIVKNFSTYKGGLERAVGEEIADSIIDALGGEEAVMNASYSNLMDSGSAFEGSFTKNVIRLTKLAVQINDVLPEEIKADKSSIGKVCLLSQIAKVVLLHKNENNWEVVNRGMVYSYNNNLEGALRTGERSTLIAMNAGVKFTPEEFEAMSIMDKNPEDDNYKKYFACPLSTVIRQASELLTLINKKSTKTNK